MPRRLALLALVVLAAGCDRYRSPRAQGPFNRQPAAPNPALARGTPPTTPGGLAIPNPYPPGAPDEAQPVPPRPPEPAPVAAALTSPYSAQSPPATDPAVRPAAGQEPQRVLPRRVPPAKGDSPVPGQPSPSAPVAAQAATLAALKRLAQTADAKIKGIDTYEARFVRRETLDGATAAGPTEEVQFQFRNEPMAVYMKNVGEVGKGREVLYNPGQFEDKIHVIIGQGDTRLYKAGSRGPSFTPDSPLVRGKSRHSIRESGLAISVGKFVVLVAKLEGGKVPADSVKAAGRLRRDEFGDHPLDGVEQTVQAGAEDKVAGGSVRHWFFDAKPDSPSAGLPVLVILYDPNGRELEYYRYTHFRAPANLTDADFDVKRLGKK